jgi:hypothetical protein
MSAFRSSILPPSSRLNPINPEDAIYCMLEQKFYSTVRQKCTEPFDHAIKKHWSVLSCQDVNTRDAQKLGAAQMRFLIPLLGLTISYRQRNPHICNRLKVNSIVEDMKLYQKKWLDHLERTDRSRLPRLAFHYQPRGRRDMGRPRRRWRYQEQLELYRNTS